MVDFDKFEKNVKENYGNQEFPFDEQNWEKAAKLIDASRKGKNRGGIFLLSAVAILCTSGLVYYFGFSDSANGLNGKGLAVNQTVTGKQNTNIDNSTKAPVENNSVSGNEENSSDKNVSSNVNGTTNTTNSINENASSVKNTSKSNNSAALNTSENSTAAKTINENKTSSANETKAEEKANTNSNSSAASSEAKSNATHANKPKNTAPAKGDPNKNTTPPVLGSNSTAQMPKNVSLPNTNETTGNTDKLGTPSNENQNGGLVKKDEPKMTDSVPAVATVVSKSIPDSVPPMRKSRADSLAAMMPKGDGVSYATNVKVNHNAKNILFMEAGTTYLLGWHGGGKTEAGGFNLLAGVNFQHYFTGNVAAQIGVLYNTIDNLSNTSHTISTVKYDLGVEQDVTSIRYQKLHYLVAPIKLTFNLKEKNIFTVGCNVAYLLNSDSKKEKYKTYSSDPNATKNNLTSTKESGYVKGFNPYDIQLSVGYRRQIYKGLSANAEFFYGLTDTKDNTFFKSNNFDRNVGFKVSLCYDLFKK
jgi:hypothetical protein